MIKFFTLDNCEQWLRDQWDCCTVQHYNDAERAVERLIEIYDEGCNRIRSAAKKLMRHTRINEVETAGCYPFIALPVDKLGSIRGEVLPYGVCHQRGLYYATVTRPDVTGAYWKEQLELLIARHGEVLIGISSTEIPFRFVPGIESLNVPPEIEAHFKAIDPVEIGDSNVFDDANVRRLAFFSALETDYWLKMGKHHMGCESDLIQPFVILANYPFYTQAFAEYAQSNAAKRAGFTEFVPSKVHKVGKATIASQMPAYHLKHKSGYGVTLVQIGVGGSNAWTISRELSVLRPHAVILAGHTGSLRRELSTGDYVIGESFFRPEPFLDEIVPLSVPIPHTREISTEMREAARITLKLQKTGLKTRLHAGTIASTLRRDWELARNLREQILMARPVSVEMEAAFVAAACFNDAIPFGTLLCASDSPLFGQPKEHNSSREMYARKTGEHLAMTMATISGLRRRITEAKKEKNPIPRFHSRRLRGFGLPPVR